MHKHQSLAERLASVQQKNFVGRQKELSVFESALNTLEPDFSVLHIYGPGGIGKTTLLNQYRRLAGNAGFLTLHLDGHYIDPSPIRFMDTLREVLSTTDPLLYLMKHERVAIFIDTYEQIKPLDGWIREEFLPQLSAQTLVVIAGRNQPDSAWRTQAGWRDLTRIIALDNLSIEASKSYLGLRKVPAEKQSKLIDFSHGHPLALALIADIFQQGLSSFDATENPEIIEILLQHFLDHTPTEMHRQTLEICAHMRVTTVATLTFIFGESQGSDLFDWLAGLSFIQYGSEGLLPHDLVRDLLELHLRWRDEERYRHLHQQVRDFILSQLTSSNLRIQRNAFLNLLYLHRHNPTMRPYYEWSSIGSSYPRSTRQEDLEDILELVNSTIGSESMKQILYWWNEQPESFTIFCDQSSKMIGFCCILDLQSLSQTQITGDLSVHNLSKSLQSSPDDRILYQRFLCAYEPEDPQITSLISMLSTQLWLGTPQLKWYVISVNNPQFWHNLFLHLNFQRLPDLDFRLDGMNHHHYGHDWQAENPLQWLDVMMSKELSDERETLANVQVQPIVTRLSKSEWEEAVRQALKDWFDDFALQQNSLLNTRLAKAISGQDSSLERFKDVMLQAINSLQSTPKKQKFYRALHETFLKPSPTQEAAAEALDLPFNTYRYQLNRGIQLVAEYLQLIEENGH